MAQPQRPELNPYTEGLPRPTPNQFGAGKTLLLWVFVLLLFLAVYSAFTGPSPGRADARADAAASEHAGAGDARAAAPLAPWSIALVAGGVVVGIGVAAARRGRRARRELATAELELARDDTTAAVARLRALLALKSLAPTYRATGLILLGECAVARGEFAQAAQAFADAALLLPPPAASLGAQAAAHHPGADLAARRAFALAGAGRWEDALRQLDVVAPAALEVVAAQVARAEVLARWRGGDLAGALAALQRRRASVEATLVVRDRLLLRAVELDAAAASAPADPPPPLRVDDATRRWILAAAPGVARVVAVAEAA